MNVQENIMESNRKVIYVSIMLVSLSILGYLVEFIKGTRSLPYVLGLSFLIFFPIIISIVCYNIKSLVYKFKYIALYSFIMSWFLMIALSPKVIQYVVVFPLMMIYTLYFDEKLMRRASIILILGIMAKIVINVLHYKMTDDFIFTEYSVSFLSMLLFSYTVISTTKFATRVREEQISSVMAEEEKNRELLGETIKMVDVISDTSKKVSALYEDLIETSDEATLTINQLSIGMNDIADNLSEQSCSSESMQMQLVSTSELSEKVLNNANVSKEAVVAGTRTIEELNESSEQVSDNIENVHNKMTELSQNAAEIRDITGIIRSIADQTNLLALNAAIESARAGEAGKSFGVVAESIRELSTQTGDALSNINDIIDRLENSANESLEASNQSKELGMKQRELIVKSKEIFNDMSEAVESVHTSIVKTNEMNKEITENNEKVVDSISNIASVVQEVADKTDVTSSMVRNNKDATIKVKSYIDDLNEVVESVGKLTT